MILWLIRLRVLRQSYFSKIKLVKLAKRLDTNLDLDGQISKGKAQLVTGIQVAFYSGATSYVAASNPNVELVNDVYTFLQNGTLILKIQSKEYVRQAPLGKFPPVERIAGNTFTYGQGGSDSSVKYAAPCGREFTIRDLLLESNQNFSVELRDLPALPSGIDGRLVVTLNGDSARNAQ